MIKTDPNKIQPVPPPWLLEENVLAGGINHLAVTNRENGINGHEWLICSLTPMHLARPIDYTHGQLISAMPELVIAVKCGTDYFRAMQEAQAEPERMTQFRTVNGESLDTLFEAWCDATEAALKKAGCL